MKGTAMPKPRYIYPLAAKISNTMPSNEQPATSTASVAYLSFLVSLCRDMQRGMHHTRHSKSVGPSVSESNTCVLN